MRTELDDKYWRRVFASSALRGLLSNPSDSRTEEILTEIALERANHLLIVIFNYEKEFEIPQK